MIYLKDKFDSDMVGWMGKGSKLTLKSVESCLLLSTKDFSIVCEIHICVFVF